MGFARLELKLECKMAESADNIFFTVDLHSKWIVNPE